MSMAGKAVQSERIDLDDGRRVTVRSYADGRLRFQVDGEMPYAVAEALLKGSSGQHAIVQLVPLRSHDGGDVATEG